MKVKVDKMVKTIRQSFLLGLDIITIYMSYILAFLIRYDTDFFTSQGVKDLVSVLHSEIVVLIAIKMSVLYIFGMYSSLWRHASIDELAKVVKAVCFSTAVTMSYIILKQLALPRGIYVISFMLDILFIGGSRFAYRYVRMLRKKQKKRLATCKNVMIIGAGQAASMIIKEMHDHPNLHLNPSVIIDDDAFKHKKRLQGIQVIGGRDEIEWAVLKHKIQKIIIAIPSISKSELKKIVEICSSTKARLEILPGVYEIIDGKINISQVRDVEVLDILGREEVDLDIQPIEDYIKGQTVLITGAGGSIGSEICRQVMKFQPRTLIMVDIYENNMYELELELKRHFPEIHLEVLIASVRDRVRIDEIFDGFKPHVVFHAAAHKHVPLMERSPKEAVKNNVFGTKNMIDASIKHGVLRFTLISTDKAVNPTNIMGTTKRICEMLIQEQTSSKTKFSAVRFGNVLGSNGSVIPIFKKQIQNGGPITITHPDIVRYFMTIPEAPRLVLQATSLAENGDVFILDMGEPVKITDLAKNMIRLSGFEEDEMPIEFIGLRPGEKMYEELLLDKNNSNSTKYSKIYCEKSHVFDKSLLKTQMDSLRFVIEKGTDDELIHLLSDVVPTFIYDNIQNRGDKCSEV